MLWFFLSWGIDYRTKNTKTKSGKFTFWNFCHPNSHCAFAFMDEFVFISKSLGIFWIFLANFCGKWIFIFSFCSPAAQVSSLRGQFSIKLNISVSNIFTPCFEQDFCEKNLLKKKKQLEFPTRKENTEISNHFLKYRRNFGIFKLSWKPYNFLFRQNLNI
jgi:hypothetical protein